jgi:Zn-finger nucleic acid-binding protein
LERRRQVAKQAEAVRLEEERERHRLLHFMRCPTCGSELQEIAFGDVRLDKCFVCEGLWFDNGELEKLKAKEAGFATRLLNVLEHKRDNQNISGSTNATLQTGFCNVAAVCRRHCAQQRGEHVF